MRVFDSAEFEQAGMGKRIVQINRSSSRQRGTIRGMHYQKPPSAEVKIVSCLRGSVYDVLVDVRRNSTTFLRWHAERLAETSDDLLLIPEGVAHGFQTLTDDVELLYLHTAFHAHDDEAGVRYDDPRVAIEWPLQPGEISDRDRNHPLLAEAFRGIEL